MRAALPLLLLAAGCGAGGGEADPNGMWTVTAIGGEAVPPGDFLLRIRGGRVVGGRDGCNSWAFDETQPPMPDGTRMIVANAQRCRETSERRTYWRALGNGNAKPHMTKKGELQLSAGGAAIIARPMPD